MSVVVVSDIFGRTYALEFLTKSLGGNIEIFDPYNGVNHDFETEEDAYFYFTENLGLERYSERLYKLIKKEKKCLLIGFSVGASAIWRISEKEFSGELSGICFYGSQIRNLSSINPLFPVKVVLPIKEDHFSVENLSLEIRQKDRVDIVKTSYLHGFMNLHSKNFNKEAYAYYLDWMKKYINHE